MTVPSLLSSLVFFLALSPLQATAKKNLTEACDPAITKIQIGTYELSGECVPHLYCDADSKTCKPRGCRTEEFPPHFPQGGDFPPLCPEGQVCPDEGSRCQAQSPIGGPCQLNRDDMCAPSNVDAHDPPYNTNGSVCINFVCMTADKTAGQACVPEQIPYIAYLNDEEFAFVVSRGNCAKGFYCDAGPKTCAARKDVGAACAADQECTSYNCGNGNICAEPDTATNKFPMWVYIAVGCGILGGIGFTMIALYFIHRRGRDDEHDKRTQYWREQTAMRQNILQMRETARSGYRGQDDNPDHLVSGESQLPMLPSRNGSNDDYSRGPINSGYRPRR